MNPKTTALLAITAALFAAFLWFYEVEGEAGRIAARAASLRVFAELPSDGSAIEWIELETSDGIEVRAQRSAGRWTLVRPVASPADGVTFDAMASALSQLAGDGAVAGAQALEIYGLGDGVRLVEFGGANESRFALRMGRAAPLGSSTYVSRSDSADVHIVPTWRVNAFDKPLAALRDARIQSFDSEAVREIAASWPGGGVRLIRDASSGEADAAATPKWKLVEPLETAADSERVESLLTDLMHLRADDFVDAPMSDAEAGLEPPDFSVELRLGEEGAAPLRVAIGQERDGLRRVRGRDGALFELASARIDDFPRSVIELRDRSLSRFVNADVTGFELIFTSGEESSRVVATRNGTEWTSEPPLRSGVAADIVANLANLTARGIHAEWLGDAERSSLGLLPPRVVLRVLGAGAATVLSEVWLGDLGLDRGPEGLVAMAVGRDEVFLLDARIAENLPVSREALDAVFVEPAEAVLPAEGDASAE